jgi:hypothetical protein
VGVQKEDCKGVKEAMGLPISVDLVSPMALGILTSMTGDEGGVELLELGGVSGLLSASVSGFSVCKASSFCEDLSVSCGNYSGLNLSCASSLKPGGVSSCSRGRVIASPCSTLGSPLILWFWKV